MTEFSHCDRTSYDSSEKIFSCELNCGVFLAHVNALTFGRRKNTHHEKILTAELDISNGGANKSIYPTNFSKKKKKMNGISLSYSFIVYKYPLMLTRDFYCILSLPSAARDFTANFLTFSHLVETVSNDSTDRLCVMSKKESTEKVILSLLRFVQYIVLSVVFYILCSSSKSD